MLNDTLSRTAVSGCRRMEYTRLHGSEYHKMLCNVIFAAVDLIHGRTALTRHVAAERARSSRPRGVPRSRSQGPGTVASEGWFISCGLLIAAKSILRQCRRWRDPANPSIPVARASLTRTELTLYSTRICALRVSIVPAVARVLAVARTLCVVFDGGRAMFWTAIHDSKTDDVIRARGPTCRRGAATCCLVREFASQRAARGLASGIVMA